VIFGSDSGGGRFVVARDSGELYFLPMAGVTPEREYLGHPAGMGFSGMEEFVLYLCDRVGEQ
jgi:hypothetical protein